MNRYFYRPYGLFTMLLSVLLFALSACQGEPSLFEAYLGDWVWVAVFEEDEPFVGYLSISERRPGSGSVADVGAGAWTWCEASGRCLHLEGDQGSLGTYRGGGERRLVVEFAEAAGFVKLIAVDEDGVLESEDGPTRFAGPGRWYFYSGGYTEVGFAMVKTSEVPGRGLMGAPRPFVQADDLPSLIGGAGSEAGAALTRRALAHLESLSEAQRR